MSLIYCPECGHEISNSAVACPNCGRPINAAPVVDRKVVVAKAHRHREGIPTWAIGTMAVLGILLAFLLLVFWSRSDDDANRLRVNVNSERPSVARQNPGSDLPAGSTVTDVPPSSSARATLPPSETSIPGTQTGVTAPPPSKGTAIIQAHVVTRNNSQQPVRGQRFYLLDRDVESILSEADVDPIEGQTLIDSLGLSMLYPSRYGDFNQRAMRAIREHIKYAGTTDSAGKAQLGGIDPNSYYLLGIVKAGNGFAVWSSPVSIQAGENVLNLTPQRITEIETSGD